MSSQAVPKIRKFLLRHEPFLRNLAIFFVAVSLIPCVIGGAMSYYWFTVNQTKSEYENASFVVDRVRQVMTGMNVSRIMAVGRIGESEESVFDWKHFAHGRKPHEIPAGEVWQVCYNHTATHTYFRGRTLRVLTFDELSASQLNGMRSMLLASLPFTIALASKFILDRLLKPTSL